LWGYGQCGTCIVEVVSLENLSPRTEVENQKLKKKPQLPACLLSNIGKWTSERGDEALTGEEGESGDGALLWL